MEGGAEGWDRSLAICLDVEEKLLMDLIMDDSIRTHGGGVLVVGVTSPGCDT